MLAALTSLALALALVPGVAVTALAAEVEDAGAAVLKALTSDAVIATGTSGTVTWTLYDDGELNFAPTSGDTGTLESFSGDYDGAPWYDYRSSIESVTVTGTVHAGESLAYMFSNCDSLALLDMSSFDTFSVTDMSCMFFSCDSLASLDVSGLDTSNATDMRSMFAFCSSLVSLDLSGFDTSNATDTHNMFNGCESLESLDLSGLDTSNVTDMGYMFRSCSSLASLDLSFFDTSDVTDMRCMFYGCTSLESLDLSSFGTSSVTAMAYLFYGCSSLTTVYVSELWSTESVTFGIYMFTGCTSLVGGNGTTYSSDHVDCEYARIDTDDTPGYFTDIADYEASSGGSDDTDISDLGDSDDDSWIDDIIDWVTGSDSSENSLPLDVWSFSNSDDYFTGWFTNDYELTDQDLEKFKNILCYTEMQSVLNEMDEEWGGSCYGMSSWVVLTALGTRSASDIDGSTDELYDYDNTDDVVSAINFYHLQQYLQPAQNFEDEFMSSYTVKEQVDELVALVEDGTPALLCFGWYEYDEKNSELETDKDGNYVYAGHAIVAYGLEDGDYTDYVNGLLGDQAIDGVEFTHRVVTYDCAYPDGGGGLLPVLRRRRHVVRPRPPYHLPARGCRVEHP